LKIEVISIGNEILRGHTLNSNLAYIGNELDKCGLRVYRETTIRDEQKEIEDALENGLKRSQIIIITGGLGPTSDDITKQTVCEFLNLELIFHLPSYQHLKEYLARFNIVDLHDGHKRQAMIPVNGKPLKNKNGTAPGVVIKQQKALIILLPGPPNELQPMFHNFALKEILQVATQEITSQQITICGVPESTVAQRTEKIMKKYKNMEIAYCAHLGLVDLTITANIENQAQHKLAIKEIEKEFLAESFPNGCSNIAEEIARLLLKKNWKFASAESCTAGGIICKLTDIPGSSQYISGGVVTYNNQWKQQQLNVPKQIIKEFGAVSTETVTAMLEGILNKNDVDVAIAVTGIAGPTGGTTDKPVGLVYIATGFKNIRDVRKYQFVGNRSTIRQRTITSALIQLRQNLI